MIGDELQDQASLYALDLLSAEEKAVFERELAGNTELQTLASELREAAAAVAFVAPRAAPSPQLKDRVLGQIASESGRAIAMPAPARRGAFTTWVPWAIAAGLVAYSGFLLSDRMKLQEQLATSTRELASRNERLASREEEIAARDRQLASREKDVAGLEKRLAALNEQLAEREERSSVVLVALKPSEDGPRDAQAVVAWDPAQQTGTIKVSNLPLRSGRDYQLWAVDAAHADPISAGVIRVDQSGVAQVQFKPTAPARRVKAFAISIEREGGVPKREGPILLIGTS